MTDRSKCTCEDYRSGLDVWEFLRHRCPVHEPDSRPARDLDSRPGVTRRPEEGPE